jgi:hypothetical protein
MEGVRPVQPSTVDDTSIDADQATQVPEVENGGEGHRPQVHGTKGTFRGAEWVKQSAAGVA